MCKIPSPVPGRAGNLAPARPSAYGIALIETVASMAVISLLLAMGMPAFRNLAEQQRAQTTLHLLSASFASARMTAISRGVPTIVCPSDGGSLCRNDSEWSEGWILFRDANDAGRPAGTADILRRDSPSLGSSLRLVSTEGRPRVRFTPDGRSAGSNLTLSLCREGEALGQVVINNLGRVRTARPGTDSYCAR